MQGVSFNGIDDKKFAPTPNEGNRCAYAGCALGHEIAEGSAARFALVGAPNQWCHKACAETWEAQVRSGAITAAPEAPDPLCAAPNPEVVGVTCVRTVHPGGNHLDGLGGGWYMDARDVEVLKANLADPVPPYVHGDAMRGEPEEEDVDALGDADTQIVLEGPEDPLGEQLTLPEPEEHPLTMPPLTPDAATELGLIDRTPKGTLATPTDEDAYVRAHITVTAPDVVQIVATMAEANKVMRAALIDAGIDVDALLDDRLKTS